MVGQGIWLRAPVVGAGYALLALLCLSFSRFDGSTESIWLSNALLVAALLVVPRGRWAVVIACAAVGHVGAHLLVGDALDFTLAYLVGDMSESAIVAALLASGAMTFASRRDVFWFLAVCLIGPFASACIAASGSFIISRPMEARDFAMWFGADALGLLFFLPLLTGFNPARLKRITDKPVRMAAAVILVFGFSIVSAWLTEVPTLRMLLLPLLVLVAFELGVAGVEICMAIMMIAWTIMVLNGYSPAPWLSLDLRDTLTTAQAFLAILGATILPLAVALEQKERLTETLAGTLKETREAWGAIIGAEARYRLIVDHVSETVMRVAPGGLILFASTACVDLLGGQDVEGRNLFELMQADEAAREQENFEHCEARDLRNLVNRRTWRLRSDKGEWSLVEARVTMIPTGKPGEHEFIVVLRSLV